LARPQRSVPAAVVTVIALVDAIAATPRSVWVAAGGLVPRLDPLTRRTVIVPDIETGQPPWVSNPATATVRRIDPRRNQVTDDMAEADGNDLTVAATGVVWATGGTRLLGLGGRLAGTWAASRSP
jgi:hypothetical protein